MESDGPGDIAALPGTLNRMPTQKTKKLNIFMVLDCPIGAYHHYSSQLCNALVERSEFTKVVFVPIFAERHLPWISNEEVGFIDPRVDIDLIGPGGRSKAWRHFIFFKNLFRHMREVSRSSPCVVHIQTDTGLQLLDFLLFFLYRLLGVPIVRTVHEPTAADRIKMPNRFEEWFGKLQLKKAAAIIVHDAQTKIYIGDLIEKNDSIFAIPHGHYLVFRKYISNEKDAEMPFNNPPVALFLGIKRHKGFEIFLQALQQLQKKNFPIKAKIVGRISPGDEDLVHKIKSFNLRNVEIHPGYIPTAEIWKVYAESDFVVLPYLRGTTSGAIHLAYAFKRPVITSDLNCFRELVIDGKTGFIVPKGDTSALAEGIIRICRSRNERIKMGEAGFQKVCSEIYSWELIAEKTAQVYTEAFKRKGRRIL